MAVVSSVSVKIDLAKAIQAATAGLIRKQVMVGVPNEFAERKAEPGEKTPPNNATIGYVQEFGDDELRIPPRPFLVPGVEAVKDKIVQALKLSGNAALAGNLDGVDTGFTAAGQTAEESVKDKIRTGPFAPLSDRTIEARAERRHKSTGDLVNTKSTREARQFLKLRGEGVPDDTLHDAGLAQPLVDTRSLLNSIHYVIRTKGT